MFAFTVFGNKPVAEAHRGVVMRLCAALSDIAVLHTVPDGEMASLAMRSHNGTKYSFWHTTDDNGILVNIDPKAGNLSKILFRTVKGYIQLPVADKELTYAALAALYGLEASDKSRCKFALTYDPTFKETYLPLNLALSLGIKVFNIASNDDTAKLIKLIQLLKGRR